MQRSDQHIKVNIETEGDIVSIRKSVRVASQELGFGVTDVTRIVTAASELARNVFKFAQKGIMYLTKEDPTGKRGIILVFQDNGPGIEDISRAMQEHYTTGDGLGLGLPGTKRLMDEMTIESQPGKGTKIMVVKWLNSNG